MGKLLQTFDTFDLWKMDRHDLVEYTSFVVRINYEHHLQILPPTAEIEACVKKDEENFPFSHFYALKTKDGKIFGTINASLWDEQKVSAFERDFKVNITQILKTKKSPPQIWHIGRFAIDRKAIKQNKTLLAKQVFYFKLLPTCAFAHVCTDPNNLLIIDTDPKIFEISKRFGVFYKQLGEAQFVMGSNVLPAINTGTGLMPFFEKHKHLLNYVLPE